MNTGPTHATHFEDRPAQPAGHRAYVGVMFADLCGSSEHAEQSDEEDHFAVLAELRRLGREVVTRHGGIVARAQGDGVLAVFGVTEPREDDGRRAVDAALELHAAITAARVPGSARALQLHTGIHVGLALIADGDIERGRVDIVGEVPNTAARLCSLAEPGQILASEETLGRFQPAFRTASLGRLVLRGRSQPLPVLRIEGRAATHEPAAGPRRTAMVGRTGELAQLMQAAGRAAGGRPGACALVGAPGVGKSRLLDEFTEHLDPALFRVLRGHCDPYLGSGALQPFVQAAADAGASPVPASVGEMVAWLRSFAPDGRTLVLAIDDWQWADDASRAVLLGWLGASPAALCVVAQRDGHDDDLPPAAWTRLAIAELDDGEAARVVAARLPAADPFVAQEIVHRAGGSPLFVEELCHAAAAGHTRWDADARAGTAGWIGSLVAERVARLPAPLVGLLGVASVLGHTFPAALLQRLTGHAPGSPELLALAAADFLYPSGTGHDLRFKHVLTRNAVYHTVPAERRRLLHRLAAQALTDADAVELRAYHAAAAGLGHEAVDSAEAAGDRAMAANALDRARTHYTSALQVLDAHPEALSPEPMRWVAIAQKLGMACVFDPLDLADGFPLFDRAAAIARDSGNRDAIARTEYWLAYLHYGRGRPLVAERHGNAAMALAIEEHDDRLAAQLHATLGQIHVAAGHYEHALPLLDRALESKARTARPGSRMAVGSAYSLARKAFLLGDLGRFDDATACFDEALRLIGDQVHPVRSSIDSLRAAVLLWQGAWAPALAAAGRSAAVALACRSRYLLAMARSFEACATWRTRGASTPVFRQLADATEWIASRGGGASTSLNHGWLVALSFEDGRAADARLHAARLFMRARWGDRHGFAIGCRALAAVAAQAGDARRAYRYLGLADNAAAARDSPREHALNLLCRADVLAHLGGPAAAHRQALVDEACATFTRLGMAWHLAQVQR